MLTLGGKLKQMENLSGRLADILSYHYLSSTVLAIVIGEAKPFLSAIIVINEEMWSELADEAHINSKEHGALQDKNVRKIVTSKISTLLASFPGYEQIRRVKLVLKPWTIKNGMLTPTMKIKRNTILQNFNGAIDDLYAGHI